MDVEGNVVQNIYDSYKSSYRAYCEDDLGSNGTLLYYPPGSIIPGYFRITVEKGFTLNNIRRVCSTDEGFVWYGTPQW